MKEKGKLLWDMLLLLGTFFVLLFLEDYDVGISLHMLIYLTMTGLCLRSMLLPSFQTPRKVASVVLLYSLLLLQLGFLMWSDYSVESRVISCGLLLCSFGVRFFMLQKEDKYCVAPRLTEGMLSFEDMRYVKQRLEYKYDVMKRVGGVMTPTSVRDILLELPRNCAIRYVNKDSLSEEYMTHLEESLMHPYVYLVLSDTGSVASDYIGILTNKPYNHISISFEPSLKTLVSYNGGEKLAPPGLNAEMLEWFYKKEDASIRVYRLAVTQEQKQGMIDKVKQINEEGSAYNVVGMALGKSLQPNIMVCSEFVYGLLQSVGASYFTKPPLETKPTDMIELDYERKLEYVETIQLSSCCEEMMEKGKPIPMESKAQVLELLTRSLETVDS